MVAEMGPARTKKLLQVTGVDTADHLFDLTVRDFLKVDGVGKMIAKNIAEFDEWDRVDQILDKTERVGARLLSYDDERYPRLLKHIYDPPLILWYKGDVELLSEVGIGVVGTRNPGRYGLSQAETWTRKLVKNGICVNSGLAYGVDAKAHKTAIEHGGKTVAVLGSGIDVIYPAKNKPLANRIVETGGVIMTEYPPGTQPDAVNFPGRNRIVSGMSHGVLVVESGVKGGSMITARYALDQNREVFVLPHPLGYLKGEGCNYLIQTGQGKLVRTIKDILEEISVDVNPDGEPVEKPSTWRSLDVTDEEKELCEILDEAALHIDQISEKTGRPTFKLLPILLELEMKGAIIQKAGKYFEAC